MSIAEKFEVIADAVYDKGRQDEWSDFWDVYQVEGKRTHYGSAFGVYTTSHSTYWNDQIYKPKYDIRPSNMDRMYQGCKITDLATIHYQLGITLDTSNCTNFSSAFANSTSLVHSPEISAIKCASTSFNNVFAGCRSLVTIDKIILPETGNIQFSTTFNNCIVLENITFEGAIGNNISFADCSLLSAESLISIIKHLVQNPDASASERKTLSIHPTAFERLGVWGSPSDAGIDFDGGWSWYLESIGWDI